MYQANSFQPKCFVLHISQLQCTFTPHIPDLVTCSPWVCCEECSHMHGQCFMRTSPWHSPTFYFSVMHSGLPCRRGSRVLGPLWEDSFSETEMWKSNRILLFIHVLTTRPFSCAVCILDMRPRLQVACSCHGGAWSLITTPTMPNTVMLQHGTGGSTQAHASTPLLAAKWGHLFLNQ